MARASILRAGGRTAADCHGGRGPLRSPPSLVDRFSPELGSGFIGVLAGQTEPAGKDPSSYRDSPEKSLTAKKFCDIKDFPPMAYSSKEHHHRS